MTLFAWLIILAFLAGTAVGVAVGCAWDRWMGDGDHG